MEDQIRDAIKTEIERQAEVRPETLRVSGTDRKFEVHGEIDLDELTAAIVGTIAGGP